MYKSDPPQFSHYNYIFANILTMDTVHGSIGVSGPGKLRDDSLTLRSMTASAGLALSPRPSQTRLLQPVAGYRENRVYFR